VSLERQVRIMKRQTLLVDADSLPCLPLIESAKLLGVEPNAFSAQRPRRA
jgi:hypothetical protein